MQDLKYILEKYNGNNRFMCPGCQQKKEFTRYVDSSGNYLADHVGKCNRSDKCGYHFTPKQYFGANGIKQDFIPFTKVGQ
ncbi:MAG: hypothetical protein IPJ32_04670 [Sphingobacteriaceae bacterium]|nr:hypothetical protein [Sphingobacteriaceae bacterium]